MLFTIFIDTYVYTLIYITQDLKRPNYLQRKMIIALELSS